MSKELELEMIRQQVAADPEDFSQLDGHGWMTCPHTQERCFNDDNSCYCCDANPEVMKQMLEEIEQYNKEMFATVRRLQRSKDGEPINHEEMVQAFTFLMGEIEAHEIKASMDKYEIELWQEACKGDWLLVNVVTDEIENLGQPCTLQGARVLQSRLDTQEGRFQPVHKKCLECNMHRKITDSFCNVSRLDPDTWSFGCLAGMEEECLGGDE